MVPDSRGRAYTSRDSTLSHRYKISVWAPRWQWNGGIAAVGTGARPVTGEKVLTRAEVLGLAIAFEGGILVLALVAGWLLHRPVLQLIEPSRSAAVLGLAATVPLLLLLAWSLRSNLPALDRLRREVYDILLPAFANCGPLDVAAISLLAGFGEEALFRGLIQTGIVELAGPIPGILVASVLFGLAHMVTPTYALLAGLVGFYLGWLFLASHNLLLPVTVHTVYDFVALTFLIREHRRTHQNERTFGDEANS